jgi:hypothetical protein
MAITQKIFQIIGLVNAVSFSFFHFQTLNFMKKNFDYNLHFESMYGKLMT